MFNLTKFYLLIVKTITFFVFFFYFINKNVAHCIQNESKKPFMNRFLNKVQVYFLVKKKLTNFIKLFKLFFNNILLFICSVILKF